MNEDSVYWASRAAYWKDQAEGWRLSTITELLLVFLFGTMAWYGVDPEAMPLKGVIILGVEIVVLWIVCIKNCRLKMDQGVKTS